MEVYLPHRKYRSVKLRNTLNLPNLLPNPDAPEGRGVRVPGVSGA